MERIKNKLKELCAIDIRSLAIFRIGLAIILIGDLIVRLQDLKAHYSDDGVLPRSVLIDKILTPWDLSLHFINGTWQVQLILFILSFIFAIALLVGFKTRIATIVSWFLLISLQSRNPMILQGGDIVLRVLLFWSMFLPLNACFSLDQSLSKKTYQNTQIVSIASLALLLQVCFIYWFSALLKTDESWRQSGTAIWYALSIEQYSTQFGLYLLQFPNLLKVLTFATLYLEAFGPFLAFSPIWTAQLRFATVLIFALFHLIGLNLTMELAHFCYICTLAWIVFIPKWFWDKFLKIEESNISLKPSFTSNMMAAFFLGFILLWNIYMLDEEKEIPQELMAIGSILRIDQYWNMFAPYPLKDDGWWVIPAILRDGSQVDLYNKGQAINYAKPGLLSAIYKNDRWRSYMMNMLLDEDGATYMLHYAKYLTNEWNQSHTYDKQVLTFDVFFMWKINNVDFPKVEHKKVLIWHHICF